jgi:hypothetical protein
MKGEELEKFIEWYKKTEDFLAVPEEQKSIHLACVIKQAMDCEIK